MTPTSPNPTWYDVLGVSRDASPAEIKAAWRNATDKFEPGSGSGQFRMFNEAADVLLDPDRRAAYDASLDAEAQVQPASQPVAQDPPPPPPAAPLVDEPTAEPTDQPATTPTPRPSDAGSVPSAVPGSRRQRRLPRRAGVPPSRDPGRRAGAADGGSAGGRRLLRPPGARGRPDRRCPGRRTGGRRSRAAKAILSYDYRRLPTDRKRAKEFLTPKYQKEYDKTFKLLEEQKDGSPGAAVQTKTVGHRLRARLRRDGRRSRHRPGARLRQPGLQAAGPGPADVPEPGGDDDEAG